MKILITGGLGFIGMALVPFVYLSVKFWRTIHPQADVVATLPPEMAAPFWWCVIAFMALYTALLLVRTRVETVRAALEEELVALD